MKHFYSKKSILFVALSFLTIGFSARAQIVNIPNANFKAALLANTSLNTNTDTEIQVTEAQAYTGAITVYSLGITDLTGIEAFPSIWYLNCNDNQITSINVSNNTALTGLSCAHNQLSTINISANTNLTSFDCSYNQLSSVNISANTSLIIFSCAFNQLSTLNVTNNTALTTLNCESNQLSALNINNNTALTILSLNNNQLTSMDFSNNSALVNVSIENDPITSLDISNKPALTTLHCDYNNLLTSLNVTGDTSLYEFYCFRNQLSSLDLSTNKALFYLYCDNNNLTSLNVSNSPSLYQLVCDHNQLTALDVSSNIAIAYLTCSNNQLTALDFSADTNLVQMFCNNNQLTSLNMKNGNNHNTDYYYFNSTANPNLTCIQVDTVSYATATWIYRDPAASFSTDCAAVGLTKTNSTQVFEMYPNPATNKVTIKAGQVLETITIYNAIGQVVLQTKVSANETQIDITYLPSGIYMINANGTLQKLIKE